MELRDALKYAKTLEVKTGLEDYPIFAEEYRETLNKKIIDHYYFEEIGFETADMFFYALGERMRLIMPMMNKAYLAINNAQDIFRTYETNNTSSGNTETSGTQSANVKGTGTASSRNVNSSFPQQMLSSTGDYATAATDSNSKTGNTSTTSSSSGTNTTSGSTASSYGRSGSIASLLGEYLESYMNIDQHIVMSLNDLFMQVWSSGESLTPDDSMFYYAPYFGGYWV